MIALPLSGAVLYYCISELPTAYRALISRFEDSQTNGADGIRTHDLRIANATLSQLSYGPMDVAVLNDCRRQRQF